MINKKIRTLVRANTNGKYMNWDTIKQKKSCLNFFDKFNGGMVRTCDKHDASRFKNKDYVIDKEDHELIVVIIINVSPLLLKENYNLLYHKLEMFNKKSMVIMKCTKSTGVTQC